MGFNRGATSPDEGYPPQEQLPRQLTVEFRLVGDKTIITVDDVQYGDPLTDNRSEPDGYRFHDVFHLAHMAVLGWSPVLRALLKRKRKSDPAIDEVQDGGVRSRSKKESQRSSSAMLRLTTTSQERAGVSSEILRTIRQATRHLEVSAKHEGDWERAILLGFEVWRNIKANQGGRVRVDLNEKTIQPV